MTRRQTIILSGALLFLDQFFKYSAGAIWLNTNFAWSWPLSNFFSGLLMTGLIIILFVFYLKANAVILILGGAFSNLIDRLIRGGVVDYLWLPGAAVINLADIMILAGLVWLWAAARRPGHAR